MADIFEKWEDGPLACIECTRDAIEHVAANLREGDSNEIAAAVGHRRFTDALALAVEASEETFAIINAYGEPLAIAGVGALSLLYNTGSPWMVATPSAERYGKAFVKWGKVYTSAMLKRYTSLVNHVDARNTKSVAWLQHIGFEIEPAEPYGALMLPFHKFSKAG